MNLFRAWTTLVWLSVRRLVWSANTLMVMFPLIACGWGLYAWWSFLLVHAQQVVFPDFNTFSGSFVINVFASFIVPICALAYATTSIGGDREDRTLLFLLVRPVPRWLILLGKVCATLPLVLGLVAGSFFVYCRLAGDVGDKAFGLYLPAMLYMAIAYVALFHFFAVSFRHSTIIALVYALFMEFFLGNMPGIVKRLAINFYGRSIVYDVGAAEGLQSPDPLIFVPVSAQGGALTLIGISVVGLALAVWIFERREYRDLT